MAEDLEGFWVVLPGSDAAQAEMIKLVNEATRRYCIPYGRWRAEQDREFHAEQRRARAEAERYQRGLGHGHSPEVS